MTGHAHPPAKANVRVLIADDHPTIHTGLAVLIHAAQPDWEICAAANDGREAIARAIELQPHLVIMDYAMPHVNGLEASGEIHRILPGIEILLFTGSQSRQTLAAAFHSDVRGCLLKSEGQDALLRALDSIRHRDRFRSHGITTICDGISAAAAKLSTLTRRQREVARKIGEGKSTKQIAAELGVSGKTIETHRADAFAKLQVHCVAELVHYALQAGLIESEEAIKPAV